MVIKINGKYYQNGQQITKEQYNSFSEAHKITIEQQQQTEREQTLEQRVDELSTSVDMLTQCVLEMSEVLYE